MKIPMEWRMRSQPTPEQDEIAELRYRVCVECPAFVELDRPECEHCGCYIEHKIYSGEERGCPLNKWELSIEDNL
jgi:hypothetical protein